MGSGEKSFLTLHLHHHHNQQEQVQEEGRRRKQQVVVVPKGCVAIKVGHTGTGEEQQRFVVPVMYLNHPLFMQLLKEAEEEYGFDQKGTITIPCHVAEFRYVQSLIENEQQQHHHHHHHYNHHHHVGCFGV